MKNKINSYYQNPELFSDQEILTTANKVIYSLEKGEIRIAEKINGEWIVNEWVKKAILLAFKFRKSKVQEYDSFDKLALLPYDSKNPTYRKVPLSLIREGVFIGKNAVIMPSYINIGAYIGQNTMIDINASIGSCAQIGANCHISANSCIGGVLEPVVANPVIIEDNCFISANSSVLDGIIVEENSVIATGVNLTKSTKIIDRESGETYEGIIPSGSVVVSGSYPSKNGVNISCAVIVKRVDKQTRAKLSINELLRN